MLLEKSPQMILDYGSNVMDDPTYATDTIRSYDSILKGFAKYLVESSICFPVSLNCVLEFVQYKFDRGLSNPKEYAQTIIQFLVKFNLLVNEGPQAHYHQEKVRILFNTLKRLQADVERSQAVLLPGHDMYMLPKKLQIQTRFLVQSALRGIEVLRIRPDHFSQVIQKNGIKFRILDCFCSVRKTAPETEQFRNPLHKAVLVCTCLDKNPPFTCVVCDMNPKDYFPFETESFNLLNDLHSVTMHSYRRSAAVSARYTIFKKNLDKKFFNKHFHWAKSSEMMEKYAHGWKDSAALITIYEKDFDKIASLYQQLFKIETSQKQRNQEVIDQDTSDQKDQVEAIKAASERSSSILESMVLANDFENVSVNSDSDDSWSKFSSPGKNIEKGHEESPRKSRSPKRKKSKREIFSDLFLSLAKSDRDIIKANFSNGVASKNDRKSFFRKGTPLKAIVNWANDA